MKAYSIEDTIIAYFDGRLSDTDSAELLHRVSVSPEIRGVFQEYESMRELTLRSARNVSVPPHLEDAVFARVAALQADEKRLIPAGFWSVKRLSVAAAVIALLITGMIGTYELGLQNGTRDLSTSGGEGHTMARVAQTQNVLNAQGTSNSSITPNATDHLATTNASSRNSDVVLTHRATVHHANAIVDQSLEGDQSPVQSEVNVSGRSNSDETDTRIALAPDTRSSMMKEIRLPEATPAKSLHDLVTTEFEPGFEMGIETSSQFDYPGTHASVLPFQDYRMHLGYQLDVNNTVGLRVREGMIQRLQVNTLPSMGFTDMTGSTTAQWTTLGELYYSHRESIAGGRAWIVAGVGGGFYNAGSLVSADLGVQIPIADRLLAGFSLAISRLHQNQNTSDLIGGSASPVIYDGPVQQNTLNGRLEYGLSYRF